MRFIVLVISLTCVGFSASAQGRVQTGEHGDYTRVVIPLGTERTFQLEGDGNSRVVILDPPGEFDTRSALRPLSAGRLLAIAATDGSVALDLGCNCEIEAYRYQERFLVLDIYDGTEIAEEEPAPAPRPSETAPIPETVPALPADAPTVARATAALRAYRPTAPLDTDLFQRVYAPIPRLASLDREPAGQSEMLTVDGMPEPEDEAPPATPSNPTDVVSAPVEVEPQSTMDTANEMPEREPEQMVGAPAEGLSDTADLLTQQLARAAAAGLLETSVQEPSVTSPPAGPEEMDETMEPDVAEGDPLLSGLPVRAANAFDVAANRDSGLSAIAAALSCAQPIGDMQSWSSGLGFDQELGALRQAAFGSDGALLRGPTIALARYYIYHGFGAEAVSWLSELEDPPDTELSMARYLDDRPGPNFPQVETLALCSGLDLLWRFVDAPDFQELALSQRQEMRLAFSGLPLGLRRMIGPDFVRRLAAEGYQDDATDVREALSRGPTLPDAETLVLEMETTDDRPTRRETEALEEQLQVAGPDAARVMREYLAARRQANDPPEEGRLLAAEALLRETSPARSEGSLWHEVLLARTLLGEMDSAFPMLDELSDAATATRQAIEASVVGILLDQGDDASLIVMSARLASQTDGHGLPNPLRVGVFDRLTAFGLDDLAEPFRLGPNDPDPLPAAPAQNWAASAGTDGPAAAVARRISNLEAADATLNPESPDDVRAALDDSRALRAELAELLGGSATN